MSEVVEVRVDLSVITRNDDSEETMRVHAERIMKLLNKMKPIRILDDMKAVYSDIEEYIVPCTYPYDTTKIDIENIGKFLKTIVDKYHIAPVEEHIEDYLDTIRLLEHDISIQERRECLKEDRGMKAALSFSVEVEELLKYEDLHSHGFIKLLEYNSDIFCDKDKVIPCIKFYSVDPYYGERQRFLFPKGIVKKVSFEEFDTDYTKKNTENLKKEYSNGKVVFVDTNSHLKTLCINEKDGMESFDVARDFILEAKTLEEFYIRKAVYTIIH